MPIDYSEYPPDWQVTRERILTRAEHRCEECGVPNYSLVHAKHGNLIVMDKPQKGFNTYKVVLTIAHLDHDKHNHQVTDDRLRAWCQRCHLNYDRPRHIAKARRNRLKRSGQMVMFP